MTTFSSKIQSFSVEKPLTLADCRDAVRILARELRRRFIGQAAICRRVVQTVLLNGHALLEGLPGEGKTSCVSHLSKRVGLRSRRVQFRPDMMPSDLLGVRMLTIKEETQGGQKVSRPDLEWVPGPIYSPFLIADEMNRAPPKVQSALLQGMQEKVNNRIDRAEPEPLYHPDDLATLERCGGEPCFGVTVPRPREFSRVPFTVFATQNPIEQEGVYPLPEAALDRFLFELLVQRPGIAFGTRILLKNLFGDDEEAPSTATMGLPLWVKTVCFLERARDLLFRGRQSVVTNFVNRQPGLWHRVRLCLHLSHYRLVRRPEWEEDEETLSVALRDREQEALSAFVAEWLHSDLARAAGDLGQRVRGMLENRLFEYVETGISTRGLLAWPQAAAAEALLAGDLKDENSPLKRQHFRTVAEDLFRHRLRLTPQARADGVRSEDVIGVLLDTFLSPSTNEAEEDGRPLLVDAPEDDQEDS